MTDEQIKEVAAMIAKGATTTDSAADHVKRLVSMREYLATNPAKGELDKANVAALTFALAGIKELHEMREMLEAAGRIEFSGGTIPDFDVERDWDFDSKFWVVAGKRQLLKLHDSALDAYREVKKQ